MMRLASLCSATFGESSAEAVAACHQLALAHISAGEPGAAVDGLERAIAAFYRHSMQHSCLLAAMHLALGVALHVQGHLLGADECYQHAIDLVHEQLGRDDPAACSAHANLGSIHLGAGELERARREFGRALKLAQCVLGVRPLKLKLAGLHLGLAECHARAGSWEEALDGRAKALAIYERTCGGADERTAGAHVDVAHAHVRLRQPARALAHLLKARAACAPLPAGGGAAAAAQHARIARLLACVYCALGRHADASAELYALGPADAEAERMREAVGALAASEGSW